LVPTSQGAVVVATLAPDLDNLRAALDWSVESAQFQAGAELLGTADNFFYQLGLYAEGTARCEPFLRAELEPSRRADVLYCASRFLFHNDQSRSLRLGSELIALGRSMGDDVTLLRGLNRVVSVQCEAEPRQAVETADEAIRLALETGQRRLAVSSMSPKGWALLWLGRPADAMAVGEQMLAMAQKVDWARAAYFARTITSAGARLTGRLARALHEAEEIVRRGGELDPTLAASGEAARAEALVCLGETEALEAVARARRIVEESLDTFHMANYESCQGRIWLSLGREEGYKILEAGTAKQESFGTPAMCVNNWAVLAEEAVRRGDLAGARRHLDASGWRLPRQAEPQGVPTLRAEARLARAQGRLEKAHALACTALEAASRGGAVLWVIDLLELTAVTNHDLRRSVEAARLLGAADRHRSTTGYVRFVAAKDELAQVLEAMRTTLGPEPFEEALAEGFALTLNEAVSYAGRGRGPHVQAVCGWDSLTPTECRIAELVATRLTNAEIAQRLFVSSVTVKSHLTRIFAKLGVSGRRELVKIVERDLGAQVPTHQLPGPSASFGVRTLFADQLETVPSSQRSGGSYHGH
jgi:DNA-binding CsgD family transcriptional regulator/tetratricopeptide (TPR) repeat protein